MSIGSILQRLAAAKTGIREALAEKGVTLSSSDGYESFPLKIASIETSSNTTGTIQLSITGTASSYQVSLSSTGTNYFSVTGTLSQSKTSGDFLPSSYNWSITAPSGKKVNGKVSDSGTITLSAGETETISLVFTDALSHDSTVYVYGTYARSLGYDGTYVINQQNGSDQFFNDAPVYYCSEKQKYLFLCEGMDGYKGWVFDTTVANTPGGIDIDAMYYDTVYSNQSQSETTVTSRTWSNSNDGVLTSEQFTVSTTEPPSAVPAYKDTVYVYGTLADSKNLTGTYTVHQTNGQDDIHNDNPVYYCSATNQYLFWSLGMTDEYAWIFRSSVSDIGMDFPMWFDSGMFSSISSSPHTVTGETWYKGFDTASESEFSVSFIPPAISVATASLTTIQGIYDKYLINSNGDSESLDNIYYRQRIDSLYSGSAYFIYRIEDVNEDLYWIISLTDPTTYDPNNDELNISCQTSQSVTEDTVPTTTSLNSYDSNSVSVSPVLSSN